jgi:hypothetical protein
MELADIYKEILADDKANVQEIAGITGINPNTPNATLHTPEKRALFLFGYRHPEIRVGCTTNTDKPNEKFIPLDFGATDMDAFFVAIGRRYPRKI